MKSLFEPSYYLGLDVGQSTVKAVLVRRRGDTAEIVAQHLLNCDDEGIVDESELREHLPNWLRQVGGTGYETVLGLPQYMATTQVTDFPPGKHRNLAGMVAYETQQLAGLSDDRFLHDYALMPAHFGYNNPVLIGICREEIAAQRSAIFADMGLPLNALAMNGIALANAYHAFYPAAATLAAPQLLLDIGTESSTIVIVAAGQVLYTSSLMFGGERYTQVLARSKGLSIEAAEIAKRSARIEPQHNDAPLVQVCVAFQSEIDSAIEHWRSQERPEIGGLAFARVGIGGGGAKLNGLDEFFTRSFGCDVVVIGVPCADSSSRDPDYLIAYGLACQGLGQAAYNISLLPPLLAWTARRRQRFTYLVCAAALAAMLITVLFIRSYHALEQERRDLRQEMVKLDQCANLVPQLQQLTDNIALRQRMLLPFAASGNRAESTLRALQQLSQARGDDDWFVYLADAESFRRQRIGDDDSSRKTTPTATRPAPRQLASLLSVGMGPGSDSSDTSTANAEFSRVIHVDDVQPWRRLIVAGCTTWQHLEAYRNVRTIVDKLNRSGLYNNVDILPDSQTTGRDDIFEQWLQLFADNRLQQTRYKAFFLELPLSNLDIRSARGR